MKELDTFTTAYIECALWSSHDNANEQGGEPLDANYDIDDLTPECLEQIKKDCQDFQTTFAALLQSAYEYKSDMDLRERNSVPDYTTEKAGHDFWLTRNRHGAGFWDRGLGAIGQQLTDMAHPYGEFNLYVTDDGKINS